MNTIILSGIRDIKSDDFLKPQRDYRITLIASRISEEKLDSESDDEGEYKYRLKVSHLESITDLKEHKELKVEKGRTPSQKLRFLIEQELGDDQYEPFINYLMSRITSLCEEFRER